MSFRFETLRHLDMGNSGFTWPFLEATTIGRRKSSSSHCVHVHEPLSSPVGRDVSCLNIILLCDTEA